MKFLFFLTFSMLAMLLIASLLTSCTEKQVLTYNTSWSDGYCNNDNDCQAVEYGCGGGHIVCTSNPEKWKNMESTCEIVKDHPLNQGFTCGCVKELHSCAWIKLDKNI
ncbi:hypothetical protein J7L02_01040 [Candidatus Woesearchaeota archaeon]|nr:hypothetical protein [Candidatus Woesearchaeota archaeon]